MTQPVQQKAGTSGRYAATDAVPQLHIDAMHSNMGALSLDLDSPLTVPPAQMIRSPTDKSNKSARRSQFNPMFVEDGANGTPAGAASAVRDDYLPRNHHLRRQPVLPRRSLDPVVTMPDVGNLFLPMATVIEEGAPAHMQAIVRDRPTPSWLLDRPHLTGDFLLKAARIAHRSQPKKPLTGRTEAEQELLLADDLLYAFLGLETQYLRVCEVRGPGPNTHLVYALSAAHCACCSDYLVEQVQRLLPIAECVVLMQRYVESRLAYAFGTVCHAFAAAVRVVLDDFALLVAQLEHQLLLGKASLQALWYLCQPALAVLQLAATVCADASCRNLSGARLLDLLNDRAIELSGDAVACKLVQRLLHAATVPYFEILTRWVSEGVLEDPYGEFMVVEDGSIETRAEIDGRAAFWTHRHTMRQRPAAGGAHEDDVPSFLRGHAQHVLAAGKCLSVLRQCGQLEGVAAAAPDMVDYDPHGQYLQRIRAYHARASSALLSVMLDRFALVGALNSIKHFFLLDQSDFLTNFLDAADGELHRWADETNETRLRSLLELAIRTSSLCADPNHERLQLKLEYTSINQLHHEVFNKRRGKKAPEQKVSTQLEAVDVLMFTYDVDWPLNIVLSPDCMRAYKFVFKHLVIIKHEEQSLTLAWQRLQKSRMLRLDARTANGHAASLALAHAHSLCHRLLFFIQRYVHYMTVEVMEPQWHEMLCAIASAASVDEVIHLHQSCLDKIMRWGFLERPKTCSNLSLMLYNARRFIELLKSYFPLNSVVPADTALRSLRDCVSDPPFFARLQDIDRDFTEAHNNLLHDLKTRRYSILKSASSAAASSHDANREEADMIENFVNQLHVRDADDVGRVVTEARAALHG